MIETLNARFKDFIILKSGEKIYPEEIEAFYTKAAPQFILYVKSGQYSPNVLRKILYFMFLIYKGKGTRNSFKDTRIE